MALHSRHFLSALLLFFLLCLLAATAADSREKVKSGPDRSRDPYRIQLGAAELVPGSGARTPDQLEAQPFLVQFFDVPQPRVRKRLERRGVALSRYVGGNTYLTRCHGKGCRALSRMRQVRATVGLSAEMKRSRLFYADPRLLDRVRHGQTLEVYLRFFDHVSSARAREILDSHRIPLAATQHGFGNSFRVRATWSELESLLQAPEVAWADPALPPAGLITQNAAERSHIDKVRRTERFDDVDGASAGVAVLDNYPPEDHRDFEDRVTRVRVRNSIDHGTAVSGIIAGAGLGDPRALGVAPAARLYWYSLLWNPWAEMAAGRERYGFSIMNNSWTPTVGWWFQLDGPGRGGHWSWREDTWAWGYYHAIAADADELVRQSDILVVFAAANQRNRSYLGPHTHGNLWEVEDGVSHQDVHAPNPEYTSIAGPAAAKNTLTVGGTTKDDLVVHFTSWGPTGDGRVKPDVVATGFDMFHATRDHGYGRGSGTSFSAPIASGTAALLTDYYLRQHGREISSVLLKNLLIHSARDIGSPGPDYESGYGLIDAELAATLVRRAGIGAAPGGEPALSSPRHSKSLFFESVLEHKEQVIQELVVARGTGELRATLVWHDPPGAQLVNDLDLWLKAPGGKKIRPFVLDGDQPQSPARRRRNRIDNVEQVLVSSPDPGTWRIVVRGSRVPVGPQPYSLIISVGLTHRPPVIETRGICAIDTFFTTSDHFESAQVREKRTFRTGDRFSMHIRPWIAANADYGDFYGSFLATFIVRNSSGTKVLQDHWETHEVRSWDPQQRGNYSQAFTIPSGMPRGSYTAEAILLMHNGDRDSATYRFSVE